jgi:hypothetical protein
MLLAALAISSCEPRLTPEAPPPLASSTEAVVTQAETPSITSAPSSTPTDTFTAAPTDTPTLTPIPTVESLKATVTADLLSCRYGPGPEYLFLYGLRKGANIILIGRTDGANWNWVYVAGKNKCWLNAKFVEIAGDRMSLPIVYPGIAKLPITPYYAPTDWVGATRKANVVEVSWNPVRISAGDYEDDSMFEYIVEVWRCESGQMLFEPLATHDLAVTFVDEPGCSQPSHGRVFVQEKHGFAGPAEVPWPPYQ